MSRPLGSAPSTYLPPAFHSCGPSTSTGTITVSPVSGSVSVPPGEITSTICPSTSTLSVRWVVFGPVSAMFSAYHGAMKQTTTIAMKTRSEPSAT